MLMKKSLLLLLGVALSGTACTGYVSGPGRGLGYYGGSSITVVAADQPYYRHGPYYVSRGQRYVWQNGHYAHRHGQRYWVHGRYVGR